MGEQVFAIFILPWRTLVRPVSEVNRKSSEVKCVGNKVCRQQKQLPETPTNRKHGKNCNGNRRKFTKNHKEEEKNIPWHLQRNNSRFLTQSCF